MQLSQNNRQQLLANIPHYAQTISRASNQARQQQQQQPNSFHMPNYQHYDQQNYTLNQQERLHYNRTQPEFSPMSTMGRQALLNRPLCRCRVMYLGSSVPHITKNGLHGIQEPLRHLYPEEQFTGGLSSSAGASKQKEQNNGTIDISHLSAGLGIDSWLSVWSNGLLLENVDEFGREVKRFFSIESLHYCAAVRFFDTSTLNNPNSNQSHSTTSRQTETEPQQQQGSDQNNNITSADKEAAHVNNQEPNVESGFSEITQDEGDDALSHNQAQQSKLSEQQKDQKGRKSGVVRFLPLDAPLFRCPGMIDAKHPPVFASIMRRTTGVKVLECHAFICRRDAASNALVRCCTQAYADFLNAKRLSLELSMNNQVGGYFHYRQPYGMPTESQRRAKSLVTGRSGARGQKLALNDELSAEYQTIGKSKYNDRSSNDSIKKISSSEDNSAEISSEDNYAIISRRHNQKQTYLQEDLARRNEAEKRAKRISNSKGLSKSLYDDFKPKTYESANFHEQPIEKLSHSMDLLDVGTNCDEDDDISYSVVKNKRHSKSMQNLDGPFEFSAEFSRSSARSKHRENRNRSKQNAEKTRKSHSYQDMRSSRKKSLNPEMQTFRNPVETNNNYAIIRGEKESLDQTLNKQHFNARNNPYVSRQDENEKRLKRISVGSRKRDSVSSRSRRHESSDLSRSEYLKEIPTVSYQQYTNNMSAPFYMPPNCYMGLNYGQYQLYPTNQPYYDHYTTGYPNHLQMEPVQHYAPYQPVAGYSTQALYAPLIGVRRSRDPTSKATLSRFRCLSPPINFISPSAKTKLEQDKTLPNSNNNTDQLKIVSANPGFISSSTMRRQKKMGWIKRLSLTMTPSFETNPNGSLSTMPNELRTEQRKKRSSLFSGSLTLGRCKQNRQLV